MYTSTYKYTTPYTASSASAVSAAIYSRKKTSSNQLGMLMDCLPPNSFPVPARAPLYEKGMRQAART